MVDSIYIGDNLTVMREEKFRVRYEKKIKVIYIDPPYNTNSSKSYNDKMCSIEWKNFMIDRLQIAREYLTEDGIIFISIDDNEYANLKVTCDEIFGKNNFIGTFITQQAQRSNAKLINTVHEYVICYGKNKKKVSKFSIKRTDIPTEKKMIDTINQEISKVIESNGIEYAREYLKEVIQKNCIKYNITWLKNYHNLDDNGNIYFAVDLSTPGKPRSVSIPEIDLYLEKLNSRGWPNDEKFLRLHRQNRLCFKEGRPYAIKYLMEAEDNIPSILNFFSRQGTNDLKKLGLANLFDTPKPVELIKFLIRISAKEGGIVLDFFAGSGTTGQAVYELRKEGLNNLNYVLIQSKEKIDEGSKVYNTLVEYGADTNVSSILQIRLERFLKISGINDRYEIFEIGR